jgi:hypothetical protein
MVHIPTIKDNSCFQLKPNVKFKYIVLVYIGAEEGNALYSHIVIDIVKGTCEIMDPHADAQMDYIYFEVCNCTGSGNADIV